MNGTIPPPSSLLPPAPTSTSGQTHASSLQPAGTSASLCAALHHHTVQLVQVFMTITPCQSPPLSQLAEPKKDEVMRIFCNLIFTYV